MYFRSQSNVYKDLQIPLLFINKYMPEAKGDYVKVYLFAYSCLNLDINFENSELSSKLNIPVDVVEEAWDYWEQVGIINRGYDFIEFLDIKLIEMKKQLEELNGADKKVSEPDAVGLTEDGASEEILNRIDRPIVKDTILHIQDTIYNKPLPPSIILFIQDLFTEYGFEYDVIVTLFSYCSSLKKLHPNYIKKIAEEWYQRGIKNSAELEAYLLRKEDLNKKVQKIKKYLNKPNITKPEEDLINKWFYVWGLPDEVVLYACSKTINIDKPSFKYIDKILETWYKNGAFSLEKVKEIEKQYENVYKKILNKINRKNPTEEELKKIDKWVEEWDLNIDLILYACGFAVKSDKPSINYIDGLLKDWKSNNLLSVESVKNYYRELGLRREKKYAPTGFHNFTEREYDEEYLESILLEDFNDQEDVDE